MRAVRLDGFRRVMLRVLVVPVRGVRVMRRFFVCAGFMVLGRFVVMVPGVLVVLGGLAVVVGGFFRHTRLVSTASCCDSSRGRSGTPLPRRSGTVGAARDRRVPAGSPKCNRCRRARSRTWSRRRTTAAGW